jgi:hypothetical protein
MPGRLSITGKARRSANGFRPLPDACCTDICSGFLQRFNYRWVRCGVVALCRQPPEAKAIGLKGQSTLTGAQDDEPPSTFSGRSCAALVPVAQVPFCSFYYSMNVGVW